MNINRHNYEEYIIDYLEGTLPEDMLEQLTAFLSNNPDIAEEVNLLEADMPVLSPDTNIVYAHKEALKKSEEPNTVAFWGNNYPKFFIMSLAAAFLLFAIGWVTLKHNATQDTIGSTPEIAQQQQTQSPDNQTSEPNRETTSPTKVETDNHTQLTETSTQNTNEKVVATKSPRTNNKVKNPATQNLQSIPASQTTQSVASNSSKPLELPLPTIQKYQPVTLATLTAKEVITLEQTADVVAFQTNPYNTLPNTNLQKEPEPEQIVLANKVAREIGKRVFGRKKEQLPDNNESENNEGLLTQVVGALVPESYAENTNLNDTSITLSFSVNSGTHQFFKNLFNQ